MKGRASAAPNIITYLLGRPSLPRAEPDSLRADLVPRPSGLSNPGVYPTHKCRQKAAAEGTTPIRTGTSPPGRARERVRRAPTPRGGVRGKRLGTASRTRSVLGAPAHHMVAPQQRSGRQRGRGRRPARGRGARYEGRISVSNEAVHDRLPRASRPCESCFSGVYSKRMS